MTITAVIGIFTTVSLLLAYETLQAGPGVAILVTCAALGLGEITWPCLWLAWRANQHFWIELKVTLKLLARQIKQGFTNPRRQLDIDRLLHLEWMQIKLQTPNTKATQKAWRDFERTWKAAQRQGFLVSNNYEIYDQLPVCHGDDSHRHP